jgi:hypothetical protein
MPEQSNTHASHYQTPLAYPKKEKEKENNAAARRGGATYYVEILILYRTALAHHNKCNMWYESKPLRIHFVSFRRHCISCVGREFVL